jgi:alkylation response protein AidB-like acyl-CoA dehydrogenase
MPGLVRDSDDQSAIRESVARICARYDQKYFLERSHAGEDVTELWAELGRAGLLGVHLPEEYAGGGGGMQEAVTVVEEGFRLVHGHRDLRVARSRLLRGQR